MIYSKNTSSYKWPIAIVATFFSVGKPTQVLNTFWFSILSVTFVVLFIVSER